jgi:hypothetical protein
MLGINYKSQISDTNKLEAGERVHTTKKNFFYKVKRTYHIYTMNPDGSGVLK